MEIKEKIIYEKEDIFELTPNPVTQFKGTEFLNSKSEGAITEPAVRNITQPLQSPNFQSGTRGWRLNSNGKSQLNDPE